MRALFARAIWCALLALSISHAALPADEWALRREDTELGVTVHDRTTPEGYREFRGVTYLRSSLSSFVALFRDTARMPEWLYRAARVETLTEVSATENYAYTVISLPWPFRDRDSIVHVKLTQDPVTQAIVLRASAVPDFRPVEKRYIRMPLIESEWHFVPLADGRTRVEFSGFADPGGRLSSGLLATFQSKLVWQSPYYSLRAMHDVIGRTEYQSAEFPYVEEPAIWHTLQSN